MLFTSCSKSGWLKKCGGRHKSWTRRFFVMSEKTLVYFEQEGDIDPRGCVPIDNLRASVSKKHLTLVHKQGGSGFVLRSAKFDKKGEMTIGNHKTFALAAASEADAHSWANLINGMSS